MQCPYEYTVKDALMQPLLPRCIDALSLAGACRRETKGREESVEWNSVAWRSSAAFVRNASAEFTLERERRQDGSAIVRLKKFGIITSCAMSRTFFLSQNCSILSVFKYI